MSKQWSINIAIVVLVEVFVGKKRLKTLFCKRKLIYSCFTECWTCGIFWIVTLLFSLAPFFVTFPTIIYGTAGSLCWIVGPPIFGIKGMWQVILYHLELWIGIFFIQFFYCIVMVKSCLVFCQLRGMEHKFLKDEKFKKDPKSKNKSIIPCFGCCERQITLLFQELNAILFSLLFFLTCELFHSLTLSFFVRLFDQDINPNTKTMLLHQLFLGLWKLTFIPFMGIIWLFPAIDSLIFLFESNYQKQIFNIEFLFFFYCRIGFNSHS